MFNTTQKFKAHIITQVKHKQRQRKSESRYHKHDFTVVQQPTPMPTRQDKKHILFFLGFHYLPFLTGRKETLNIGADPMSPRESSLQCSSVFV